LPTSTPTARKLARKNFGNQHHAVTVDVTDEASVQQLFEQIGHVDVVVNSAGFGGVGLITELPADQFRAVIDTCLVGAFLGHQACRPPPR
jgi:3-oxoacyl-[acyl-carrier protein] reductase